MQQYVSTRYYLQWPMISRQLCASSQRRPPVSSIQGASTARLQSLQATDRLPQLAEVAFEYFRHRSSMPMPSCDVWQPLEAFCLLVWRVCSFFITPLSCQSPKGWKKKYGTQTREIKLRGLTPAWLQLYYSNSHWLPGVALSCLDLAEQLGKRAQASSGTPSLSCRTSAHVRFLDIRTSAWCVQSSAQL